ncbi:MAG TPA: hypothetical protein VKV02_08245 [Acidobacteriaceae bacterium]|nr:hypothetical protein [Acidobacteriaceae bacterium]
MAAVIEKGSPTATTINLHTLLNYCRTVVRSDDDLLKHAMLQYEQSLTPQQRRRVSL